MQVRELMSIPAHTCSPQDSLESAARLLWEHDCGMLPVVDRDGRVGAAITDRDICMGAFTRGKSLGDLRVAESMSKGIVTCRADEDVVAAARRMGEHRVRRLPVVDADGKVCGLLSLNDLALGGDQDPAIAREAAKVLTEVCRHRAAVPTVTAQVDFVLASAAPAPAARSGAPAGATAATAAAPRPNATPKSRVGKP